MKKPLISMAGVAVFLAAGLTANASAAVDAAKAGDLANKSGCMACHGIDKKVVGPAFKDVGKKYKGKADAEAALLKKVKEGGVGAWGPIPMPANAKVSDADIKTLVEWILSLN